MLERAGNQTGYLKTIKKRRKPRKANRFSGLAAPEGLAHRWREPAQRNQTVTEWSS